MLPQYFLMQKTKPKLSTVIHILQLIKESYYIKMIFIFLFAF